MTAHKYRGLTNCTTTNGALWKIKEGVSPMSLERLIILGRNLGIECVLVPIEGPMPPPQPRYKRVRKSRAKPTPSATAS